MRFALQNWRLNAGEVNDAVAYFLRQFRENSKCHNALFNIHFFIPISDVLHNGIEECPALHQVCSAFISDFFSPEVRRTYGDESREEDDRRFEVALRCARAMFSLSTTDYSLIETPGYSSHALAGAGLHTPEEEEESGAPADDDVGETIS